MFLLNSSPYLGMFCFNLYHNSTYQTMKPFAVLSIIIFIKLFNKYYDTTISILEWISFAIVNSDEYLKLENKENIAINFCNDTYFSDQNACTSPRTIVWLGKEKQNAKKYFGKTFTN